MPTKGPTGMVPRTASAMSSASSTERACEERGATPAGRRASSSSDIVMIRPGSTPTTVSTTTTASPPAGVDAHARPPPPDVEEIGDVELLAAAPLDPATERLGQLGQDVRDCREGGFVVAPVGRPADEDAEIRRPGGHPASSTLRSRKCVAHEMQGS